MTHNAYSTYEKQAITTMTRGEMLLALYDGALKDLSLAQEAFRQNDIFAVNENLQKTQRILHYLQTTLDDKYEIAANLSALYAFFAEQVMQANVKKEPALLDEVIKDLSALREAFAKADKSAPV